MLQVIPGRVLRLLVKRRDIGPPGLVAFAPHRAQDQVVDRRDRLAGPAVAHQDRPALAARMIRLEGRALPIGNYGCGSSSASVSHRIRSSVGPFSPGSAGAWMVLPSTRSKISRSACSSPLIAA